MKFSRKKHYYTTNLKFAVKSFVNNNKWLLILLAVTALIGLITGIFVALKSGICLENLDSFKIIIISYDNGLEFAGVWDKFWSVLLNLLVISVASLYVLLLPLGFIVVAYRAYILGFNLAVLCCLFGLSGACTSILILFPCQIILLALLVIYTILMVNISDSKKRYGRPCYNFFKCLILILILALVICVVESLILCLFSANSILRL